MFAFGAPLLGLAALTAALLSTPWPPTRGMVLGEMAVTGPMLILSPALLP
jgi:hypothetical protein